MARYTNLPFKTGSTTATDVTNVILSSITKAKRDQLRQAMDNFTSFTWCGVDAFETFGAFIINNKNSLKFYNGPSYSNEYTKPQFESAAGQLTGVTFQTQKIDFTIGVYWISEDHYRHLIHWLNPYEMNTLTFGFEPNYYYQVKLASVADGTRYIIGREDDEYMYYTEMKITFEVQGTSCAYRTQAYEFKENTSADNSKYIRQIDSNKTSWKSDKDIPFEIYFTLNLDTIKKALNSDDQDVQVLLNGNVDYNRNYVQLFNMVLDNLSFEGAINFVYNSQTSLLFIESGDSSHFLVSRLSTAVSGKRFINSLSSQQYSLPGTFDIPDFDITKVQWTLSCEISSDSRTNITVQNALENIYINMRARTNLL